MVVKTLAKFPATDRAVEMMESSPELPLRMLRTICGSLPPKAKRATENPCNH